MRNHTAAQSLNRVLRFPPFLALLLGLLLVPFGYPNAVESILHRLGDTLALLSVGYQLRLADAHGRIKALCLGFRTN